MNLKLPPFFAAFVVPSLLLAGCATLPPVALVEARDAYTASAAGPTSKLAPTDLYEAEKALVRANKAFAANGDTLSVRDYSYVALRKVQLADVKGRTEGEHQKVAEAMKQGIIVRDSQVKTSQAALASSREQLKTERAENDKATDQLEAENDAQAGQLDKRTQQLQTERAANKEATTALKAQNAAQDRELDKAATQLDVEKQGRIAAEGKLAGAMKDLSAIAAIKNEERGVVITLSDSVLFASGKFALLESARTKLDQVAEALKDQSVDKKMVVEGHTDDRGSDAVNQPLSLSRAAAVRDYLVGRGVDSARISAIGLGSSHALLDNSSAENRANNRRVEIVITPTAHHTNG
jgi:outer membrane protein OmpA-like peptidoglycan-associated protein